jgi:hypothetical protein
MGLLAGLCALALVAASQLRERSPAPPRERGE